MTGLLWLKTAWHTAVNLLWPRASGQPHSWLFSGGEYRCEFCREPLRVEQCADGSIAYDAKRVWGDCPKRAELERFSK